MLKVTSLRPHDVQMYGNKLTLFFTYQHVAIEYRGDTYQFIPVEGKEIIVDLYTRQVRNLADVFVFQSSNRFIRLPLYQLLLISNLSSHLTPIVESFATTLQRMEENTTVMSAEDYEQLEVLYTELEEENIRKLIDKALDEGDEQGFQDLAVQLQNLEERKGNLHAEIQYLG